MVNDECLNKTESLLIVFIIVNIFHQFAYNSEKTGAQTIVSV